MKSFTAGPNENGVRLSRFVEGVTKDMPRSMMYKAFRNKRIKVNGKKGVAGYPPERRRFDRTVHQRRVLPRGQARCQDCQAAAQAAACDRGV